MIFFLSFIFCRNFAVLINTSVGYTNYRHATNITVFDKILKNNGFTENDIIFLTQENFSTEERSPLPYYLPFNIECNYKPMNFTTNTILNILSGNHPKFININDSNLLIYICGHSSSEYMRLHNRSIISPIDIRNAIAKSSKYFSNIFIIFDTCYAEIFFKDNLYSDLKNVYFLATSKEKETSKAYSRDYKLGIPAIDLFPFYFYNKFILNLSLEEFLSSIKPEDLHANLHYRVDDKTVRDFFMQRDNQRRVTKF
ncbi:GPI-anchor transamidase [Spraguea lophii 42_110]|uniref:GPI-anchor transamidase n=1 Tax=Spraguea lophii (strain 42_110) TaxID=1358809 RepID=S7XGF1_SPRLO|nr:GPI-anchor transamidase [Spraguea lophii 42_110]